MPKTELEYRPEQFLVSKVIHKNFKKELKTSEMERKIRLVKVNSYVQPTEYSIFNKRVDNYYEFKLPNGKLARVAVDCHGTWHTKQHVQHWDADNRDALEWNGYYYVELRNYPLREEVPLLYAAVEKYGTMAHISITGEEFYDMEVEILKRFNLELLASKRRDVDPMDLINFTQSS